MPAVGRNVVRKDSAAKVAGLAQYVDDVVFPGMLYGRTIRSEIARGRVRRIERPFHHAGFTVVDASDIPGRNVIALIEDDQPCLSEGEIRHQAEPILLLAHESRAALRSAEVRIDYETEPPRFDPPHFDPQGATHVFKTIAVDKGDLERGMADADLVVEGEYSTGHQEQLYIETNGVIAVPEGGGITIHGSLQCPYYVHEALKVLLDLPDEKVRVKALECGGGFGGKEEYPSMIAGHAALLALKSRRPVKLVYDREEDLVATTKRHPSIVRHRTGVKRDGTITAMEIDVLMDGGAYCTLSPVVLSRGVLHATGPYRADHVRIRGRVVRTDTPPNGAFRGFGAPQTQFASEVHMERIAETLGLDSVAIREKNALRTGDTTATGQVLGEDCAALAVLRAAVTRSDYVAKRKAGGRTQGGRGRGVGLALFFHGSGFTGSGESTLASRASLRLEADGVRVLVSSTEIGQGTRTMLAQIVADALEIPYDDVLTDNPDTGDVPDSGPTVASRTCMVVGEILRRAAETMKAKLGAQAPREFFAAHGGLTVTEEYDNPARAAWDETTYRGDAYAAYGWACDVAEIEFDRDSYEVRPTKVTMVQDVGRAIHPISVAGQIEGGTAQGVGMAVNERVVMRDGKMANAQLTNYTIPTTLDTPAFDTVIHETPFRHGPFGAKGVGEMPIDGAPPAVVNAIRHLGIDVREVPIMPERLMELELELELEHRCGSS